MAKKKKGWGNKRKGSAHRKSAFSVGAATDNLAAVSPADASEESLACTSVFGLLRRGFRNHIVIVTGSAF